MVSWGVETIIAFYDILQDVPNKNKEDEYPFDGIALIFVYECIIESMLPGFDFIEAEEEYKYVQNDHWWP